jgi:hypothetical protein
MGEENMRLFDKACKEYVAQLKQEEEMKNYTGVKQKAELEKMIREYGQSAWYRRLWRYIQMSLKIHKI